MSNEIVFNVPANCDTMELDMSPNPTIPNDHIIVSVPLDFKDMTEEMYRLCQFDGFIPDGEDSDRLIGNDNLLSIYIYSDGRKEYHLDIRHWRIDEEGKTYSEGGTHKLEHLTGEDEHLLFQIAFDRLKEFDSLI